MQYFLLEYPNDDDVNNITVLKLSLSSLATIRELTYLLVPLVSNVSISFHYLDRP